MTLLVPVIATSNFTLIITLFAISTFLLRGMVHHGADLPSRHLPGSAGRDRQRNEAGRRRRIGTITSTLIIGRVADKFSFEPILIGASLLPVIATIPVSSC
jgi:hypothetical protein